MVQWLQKSLLFWQGAEMNAKEFCEKQIAYWANESRKASDNADLKAFEFAEQELANYREMLKRYAVWKDGFFYYWGYKWVIWKPRSE